MYGFLLRQSLEGLLRHLRLALLQLLRLRLLRHASGPGGALPGLRPRRPEPNIRGELEFRRGGVWGGGGAGGVGVGCLVGSKDLSCCIYVCVWGLFWGSGVAKFLQHQSS